MNYNPKALSSYSGIYGIHCIPVILIPTSFTSLDDFTLSCFDRVEESLGITLNPVITISGTTFVAALLTPPAATVKTNGAVAEGVPVKLPVNAAGVPENKPDGNVTVIVSPALPFAPATKSFVTFKDSVNVPPDALVVHAAVPLNPGILGIHFFASAFHVVPTSQQPGP